jgi:hypothetical protein
MIIRRGFGISERHPLVDSWIARGSQRRPGACRREAHPAHWGNLSQGDLACRDGSRRPATGSGAGCPEIPERDRLERFPASSSSHVHPHLPSKPHSSRFEPFPRIEDRTALRARALKPFRSLRGLAAEAVVRLPVKSRLTGQAPCRQHRPSFPGGDTLPRRTLRRS